MAMDNSTRSELILDVVTLGDAETVISELSEKEIRIQDLRESNDNFRLALAHSNFIPARFDRDQRYCWIHNLHSDYDPVAVIGKRDDELDDSPGARRLRELKQQVIETGKGVREEIVFKRSDGVHWYDVIIEPLRNAGGEITGGISTAYEITGQKLAENALRESEERLRVTLLSAADEIWIVDTQQRILSISDTVMENLGVSSGKWADVEAALNQLEILRPDGSPLPKEDAILPRALHGEVIKNQEEMIRNLAAGQFHWRETSGAPVRNTEGKIIGAVAVARDITQRKQAESDLRRANESRASILESISDSFLAFDTEWRLTDINQRALQYMNKSASDVLGKNIWEVFPFIVGTRLETFCREAMAKRQTMTFIGSGVPVTDRIFELSAHPKDDGLAVFSHDVTERVQLEKKLEEALRAADEERLRLAAVFEALPVAIAITDRAGGLLNSNDRDAEIWGKRPPTKNLDDYGQYKAWWADTGKPVEPSEWASAQAVTEGRTVTGQLMKIQRFDGPYRFVLNSAAPIYDATGQIIGSAIAIQDVTDLHQARESLQESEALYRAIARNFPGGAIYVFDHDLRFRVAEGESMAAFGCTRESLEGKTIWEATDEELCKILAERYPLVLAGESLKVETEIKGHVFASSYVPIKNNHGKIIAGMVVSQDITESRRAEERLRQFNAMLERGVAERTSEIEKQSRRLRELTSQLSRIELRERRRLAKILHDHIQQLIVAARMQIEWLRSDPRPERVLSVAENVDAILSETLEASRSLTVELSPPVLNEAGLTGGLNWLASRMWEKNQFSVNLQLDSRAEPDAEETRFLLFECVRELLFNVVKHADSREADVILMRSEGGDIQLMVRDNGRGFDPETLRTRPSDDSSFGLFSIQERLADIGGRMEIESAFGQGTRVTLAIPAADEKLPAEVPFEHAQVQEGVPVRPVQRKSEVCRVLIVDDHRIVREGLVRLLQAASDIEVVGEASDGPQAIQLAQTLGPDVVIMDVNLGEMDGVETTRRILAENPKIKVIGLSMHIEKYVAAAMRNAGAYAYLTKGGPSSELIDTIKLSCIYDPEGSISDSTAVRMVWRSSSDGDAL
jgi:PAS domain S-box-containing protein